MEKLKYAERHPSGESTQATPSPACPPPDPQPTTSAVIDEKIGTDHQLRTYGDDSETTIQEFVPNCPSLEEKTATPFGISNEMKTTMGDTAVLPIGLHSNPVPHSLDTSKDGLYMVQPHLKDESSVRVAVVQINNDYTTDELGKKEDKAHMLLDELNQHQVEDRHVKQVSTNRAVVDTAAPFESVKKAVSMFGGIVDRKVHKAQSLERRKHVQREVENVNEEIAQCNRQSEANIDSKVQVVKELASTKRLVEELKLSLERSQTEKVQASKDLELAPLEVSKSRHEAAVSELKSMREELEALRGEYASLVCGRDMAIAKAEEAASASKDVEKMVEDLSVELFVAKESLESAHASHLEAEERRLGAAMGREKDRLNWEKELKQAEEEVQQLDEQLLLAKDLKSKLDTASSLLLSLKAELAAYMEFKLTQEQTGDTEEMNQTSTQEALSLKKKELEEVKSSIEKAKDEVNCLRVAALSLKAELDSEKAALAAMRRKEGTASMTVSSLEVELNKTKQELELVLSKEKEDREKMAELPKLLQQAAHEVDRAKAAAQLAREKLRKAKEETEQAKASEITMETRLCAALKEIEAAKASESLAITAVKALEESEQAAILGGEDGMTLSLEEYYILSKRAYEAEELASERVTAAIAQIEEAKDSELRSLERLEEAYMRMDCRKQAVKMVAKKSERAKERKSGEETKQRRRSSSAAQLLDIPSKTPPTTIEDTSEGKMNIMPESVACEWNARRKKSFFPRIVTFLGRKKDQSFK